MSATPTKISARDIKTRDLYTLMLISGVTKSGFQKNRKHDTNKKACRKSFRYEE